jgi:hypothetical protein
LLWWTSLHVLLGAAVLQLAAGIAPAASAPAARGAGAVAGLLALALHARCRFPRTPGLLLRSAAGLWSVPERGLHALELGRGTSCSGWWTVLVLGAPLVRARVLVLRDQVGAESWRLLSLTVRECRNAVE